MKNNSVTKRGSRYVRKLKCSQCHGFGAYSDSVCKVCKGKGWLLR